MPGATLPAHPELIAKFRAGLRSGALPPGVTARDPAEAGRRFAVYRNNVAHSLGRALATRFPVVERLLGQNCFRALAAGFLAAHPPMSPQLFRWGDRFPDWLASLEPLAGLPYLPDVARLEWLRGEAYHAADAPTVSPAALNRAAQDPAQTGVQFHPSVRVLQSPFAAVTIWRMNQPDETPRELDAGQPEAALILRDPDDQVPVLPLTPGDAVFVSTLMQGDTLLAAAGAGLAAQPGHQAGPLLLMLVQTGALTDFPTEDTK